LITGTNVSERDVKFPFLEILKTRLVNPGQPAVGDPTMSRVGGLDKRCLPTLTTLQFCENKLLTSRQMRHYEYESTCRDLGQY